MKAMMKAVGVVMVGVVVAGCASTAPPAARVDPAGGMYPQVTVEPTIQAWIVVARPTVTKDEVMRVSVPVRLATNMQDEVHVQYQFTFLDKNGVPLPVQSGWRMITLPSRMQRVLEGTALDKTAADWQLEIRSGR